MQMKACRHANDKKVHDHLRPRISAKPVSHLERLGAGLDGRVGGAPPTMLNVKCWRGSWGISCAYCGYCAYVDCGSQNPGSLSNRDELSSRFGDMAERRWRRCSTYEIGPSKRLSLS